MEVLQLQVKTKLILIGSTCVGLSEKRLGFVSFLPMNAPPSPGHSTPAGRLSSFLGAPHPPIAAGLDAHRCQPTDFSMKELWQRLRHHTPIGWELGLASFVINLLGLATALYSTQVMNRYLSLGIDATLVTLTLGALLALVFEVLLRNARASLAQWTCAQADARLGEAAISACAKSHYSVLDLMQPAARREALGGLTTLQQSFGSQNLVALLDAPFAALFVLCLFMLNIPLALLTLTIMGGVVAVALLARRLGREPGAEQTQLGIQLAGYQHTLATSAELVRVFKADAPVQAGWRQASLAMQKVRSRLNGVQTLVQNNGYSGGVLLGMLVMGLGAREVIAGKLDVGTLIGANILAGRALANLTRLLQMAEPLERGQRAMELLGQLARLPRERTEGTSLGQFAGRLRFEDVAFAHPRQPAPLIEHLDFELRAGGVLAVTGANGTGKTSFARLLAGLLEPSRGRVLVDGMDLRQVLPDWWRSQVAYLPQEPQFFDGTLRENLAVLRPDAADGEILNLCRELALGDFVDGSPDGLQMAVRNGGAAIPVGIRRRLALVRALVGNGQLVVLDDPTEGIDAQGCRAIASLLNRLVSEGKTLIAMTNEPFIINAAEATIDLNAKPVPKIARAPAPSPAARPEASGNVTPLRAEAGRE
jgi:ATP-binding cassette subfamily C protein LapB